MNKIEFLAKSFVDDDLICRKLFEMAQASDHFACFLKKYESKISRKFENCGNRDDYLDVFVELEMVFFLLNEMSDSIRDVQYESSKRGPDLKVTTLDSCIFNVEVKRIREFEAEKNYVAIAKYLHRRVKAENIGVNVSLNLSRGPSDELNTAMRSLSGQEALERVFTFIADKARDLQSEQKARYHDIPSTNGIISVSIWRPSDRKAIINTVSWGLSIWGLSPKSTMKLRNDILEKADNANQFPCSAPNILALRTWNMYIMQDEFIEVMEMFESDPEIAERIQNIAGILYIGPYSDWLYWQNVNSIQKLPKNLDASFRALAAI